VIIPEAKGKGKRLVTRAFEAELKPGINPKVFMAEPRG
jgi:hypothetical protein